MSKSFFFFGVIPLNIIFLVVFSLLTNVLIAIAFIFFFNLFWLACHFYFNGYSQPQNRESSESHLQ
jgi:Na+/phosphate symporter